jgi:hypothetical protein
MLSNEIKNELVGLIECATRLGVPPKWLKREADSGSIPCLRIGRKHLFNLTAVKRTLASRADQASPEIQGVAL